MRDGAVRAWLLALVAAAGCPALVPAQTLWDRRDAAVSEMFHDYRARRVGDVLTVIIDETTELDAQEARSLAKATQTANTVTGDWNALTIGQLFKGLGFQVDLGNVSNRTFQGSANATIDRKFSDRMTFVVIDVMPNGNLVVEGVRQRLIARELRTLRLTGVVRPADISFNNVVQSQSIANLYFTYEGHGPESTATNQNWGGRIFNFLWPF